MVELNHQQRQIEMSKKGKNMKKTEIVSPSGNIEELGTTFYTSTAQRKEAKRQRVKDKKVRSKQRTRARENKVKTQEMANLPEVKEYEAPEATEVKDYADEKDVFTFAEGVKVASDMLNRNK